MPADADVMAAEEIYDAGRRDLEKVMTSMGSVRDEAEAMGILKTLQYQDAHNEMMRYAVLYKVKQTKEYKNGGMTWDEFCEKNGESSRNVNRILKDMRPIYDKFSDKASCLVNIPLSKIRYLGRTVSDNVTDFEGDDLVVDGRKIPLTPENKDEVEAVIESLRDAQKEEKKRLNSEIRTLRREKKSALDEAEKGFRSERDALLEKIEDLEKYKPEDRDRAWFEKFFRELHSTAVSFEAACRKFMTENKESVIGDREFQGKIIGMMEFMEGTFTDLRDDFEREIRSEG